MAEPTLTLSHRVEPSMAVSCWSCGARLRLRHVKEAWIEAEVEAERGWTAAYRIQVKDDQPLITEARLFPAEQEHRTAGQWSNDVEAVPTGGLSSRALRALLLREPRSLFPKFTKNIQRHAGIEVADQMLARFGLRRTDRLGLRRPGRIGRPHEFYLVWAVAYVQRVGEGSRQPVKDLAQNPPESIEGYVSTRKRLSVETVRGFLNEARDRGLLTRSPSGKAGGRLTAKAWRILEAGGLDPHS